jgi:YD repeat-containing protein
MIRRIVQVFAILAFALTITCGGAWAQAGDPCTEYVGWASSGFQGLPPIPPWFVYSDGPCQFCTVYAAKLASCAPPNAQSESCPFCPAGARPISLATGDTYIQESDVNVPGLGGGLKLLRTWNSLWPISQAGSSMGMFGQNWRSTYEERVFMGSDHYLKYGRSNGSYWSFGLGIGKATVVAAPANEQASFSVQPTVWTITFQNGEQRWFNPVSGMLVAIVDRNGNTTSLTYDNSNRLASVTSAGAQTMTFNYTGSSLLVSSVTSNFGVTISYTYDSQSRLSTVTYPDSSTISFTYNTLSQITQVTDSNGKVLESHTYDSTGRGLSASQANGVNALTVSYSQ